MRKHIALLQNNKDYEAYLGDLLIEKGFKITKITSDLELLKEIQDMGVDVVVTSFNLPNVDGESFYRKLCSDYPDLPIIFISHEKDIALITSMLTYKTCEFMVKPIVPAELIARINVQTQSPSSKTATNKNVDILKIKDLSLDNKTKKAKRGKKEITLTPTEFKLLEYLMVNKNNVLSRDSILNKIWGTSSDVSDRIVDVYIGYLRDKIDKRQKEKLIETVPGFGYCLKD